MKVSKKIARISSMTAKKSRNASDDRKAVIKLTPISMDERQKLRISSYQYLLP